MNKRLINRVASGERKYIEEVLTGDFRSSKNGLMLRKLEESFASLIGTKYAIGQINGTSTLHSALYAVGVEAGDEVVVSPLTMSSTSIAVLQQDAIPIFADVDQNSFNISPKSIEDLISPKTKAIITVALYGFSPDMDPIMKLAKKYNIAVIEDDAQALLARYKDKLLGTIGQISSFSFQSSKHITAGEGGMACTNNIDLAERIRKFSVLGYAAVNAKKGRITKDDVQNPNYDRHVCLGYNYRMPDLCAAVLLGQLDQVDELVKRRIDVAKLFLKTIKTCSWLIPQKTDYETTSTYWSFAVRLIHKDIKWTEFRKKFMDLGGDGIYAAWKLSYLEPMFQEMNFSGKSHLVKLYKNQFQKLKKGLCPVAEKIQPQILAFKTDYWNWDEAEKQANILAKTIEHFNKLS